MKQKKSYIQPNVRTSMIQLSTIVCMSPHDEEAPIVGAKKKNFLYEDYFEEDEYGR